MRRVSASPHPLRGPLRGPLHPCRFRFLFLASLLVFALPATAVVSQSDILGDSACYQGDALNRLTQITYPDGSSSVAYRPDGRKQSETDPNDNTVQYDYDPLGRINQVTLTANGTTATTRYAYDEQGNKTSQTDAEGKTTKWAYDNGNRAVKRTLPNGETETHEYDQSGNRIAHTAFDGQKTRYAYDLDGKRLCVSHANLTTDSTAKWTLDSSANWTVKM